MEPRFSSAVFLILSSWLWNAECRDYNQILKVLNGERFGKWGEIAMCPQGYADGFSLKVQPSQGLGADDSALNGIRLHCSDGKEIESTTGDAGDWGKVVKCSSGNLMSFALRVEKYLGAADDTAANNIKFTCQDQKVLKTSSTTWGKYGEWSESCKTGALCGIKTKVEPSSTSKFKDNTGLNDVQFVCCD
ncbi:vitelline membrane outer layer protein 1-like [Pantherophis guttatus]|uniref:Vitelline membrane outer layer protein 1-like n=1 Tax=Pantherophis guttatus TaxID=94885 RepID=A0A6P9BT79_PANGU|nr:vitelline membrane outer layer protein 1-like [Pantherophis guttatus]